MKINKHAKKLARVGKAIAKDAVKAAVKEFAQVAKTHGLNKEEAKIVGKTLAAEAKREGKKIGAFLADELDKEMHKAAEAIKAYAKHGRKSIKR
ncbi:hypothetical protein HY493_03135 [Candidatus Woesearchaeota archaeon]|nr:hypothetical protein [Candidatus Woesearchaeota archaeon]